MSEPPRRILFVDDDPALSRLVQRDFGRYGYDVVIASTGAEGEALAADGFDAVCLDHYMPDRDGLETLRRLRSREGLPPIVYVTGSEDGRIAIAALRAGASDYVIKDASPEFLGLLRVAVEDAIERDTLRRQKERIEREVREARDRAEELAQQRAVLLREVNHRVANSLQLISALTELQAASVADPAARQALSEMSSRVVAIAQVHRRLYTSGRVGSVELGGYIVGLVEEIRRSLGRAAERLEFDVQTISVDVATDAAVSLGVIVTELVTNAVKYAYPEGTSGPIRVLLVKDRVDARLVVSDDGVGMSDAEINTARGTGIGQRIIDALAANLRGAVERASGGAGTRVTVSFPLNEAEPDELLAISPGGIGAAPNGAAP